jgi:hypothetical protein
VANSTLESIVAPETSGELAPVRTSEILRGILTKNPGVRTFTVQSILASIGSERVEASLMMFSIPAIIPVPGPWGIVSMPTGAIACQMVAGRKEIKVPRFIARKAVSRKALAVALHAILPLLEAAEKVVRPRWSWVGHSSFRRAIGVFVFLLAIAIAYPLFGFNALHATSIFVMALGMAEQDGVAVLLGVAVGVLSLLILAAGGLSARAVRARAGRWLRRMGQKLGLAMFARFLARRGFPNLARLLTFQWSKLLLLWNPERRGRARPSSQQASPMPRPPKIGLPVGAARAPLGPAFRAA